jgi:superfamily II DNA/RNA helicase
MNFTIEIVINSYFKELDKYDVKKIKEIQLRNDKERKRNLAKLIKSSTAESIIIYCSRCATARKINNYLQAESILSALITAGTTKQRR